MAKGFRVTGALLQRSHFWKMKNASSHMGMFHIQPPELQSAYSSSHHPAAHCISMATSRPGPWMLAMSARGRGEREGETERRNDIKILRKIAS